MVTGRCIASALVFASPVAVASQDIVASEAVDGYSVTALRGYWNAATEIEDNYRFDHRHAEAADAVEDGRIVLTVDRYSEEAGSLDRKSLIAHCNRDIPDGGRLRSCRYRLIISNVIAYEPVAFDALGAAARLREAGVTPEFFNALTKDVPPTMTVTQVPDRWGEVRRIHRLIIAPVIAEFDENSSVMAIDSATCPAMLRPLANINGIALAPLRIPGMSNEPKYRPSVPHSPTFDFELLSGHTAVKWSEGAAMGPSGNKILRSLREIKEVCAE